MSILTTLDASAYDRTAFARFAPSLGFNLDNARAAAWLSQLSYETDEPAKVTCLLGEWGLTLPDNGLISASASSPLPLATTKAILARHRDAMVLAFAGTDPLVAADWVKDFDVAPRGESTRGFALAVATAMPTIRRVLAGTPLPIVVTGHSLGGALAVLAARDLARAHLPVVGVYTFGMPRPGGVDLRADYDGLLGATTYRLVLGNDIVPTVAPSFLGFRHVGRLLRQARGRTFRSEDLVPGPGSDDPPFVGVGPSDVTDHLRATLASPAAEEPGEAGGPSWAGRPEIVRLLLQALPRGIKDHLTDSYLTALAPS